jgi:hypothetical protein
MKNLKLTLAVLLLSLAVSHAQTQLTLDPIQGGFLLTIENMTIGWETEVQTTTSLTNPVWVTEFEFVAFASFGQLVLPANGPTKFYRVMQKAP